LNFFDDQRQIQGKKHESHARIKFYQAIISHENNGKIRYTEIETNLLRKIEISGLKEKSRNSKRDRFIHKQRMQIKKKCLFKENLEDGNMT
jgi:hypothetical protein